MAHLVKPCSKNCKRVENVVAARDLPQHDSYYGGSDQTEESYFLSIHVGLFFSLNLSVTGILVARMSILLFIQDFFGV